MHREKDKHNGLLQAIFAAPDEDAPRLEYAQWLETNGDSMRAELIRVQIAIARRISVSTDQLAELESRERALLTAHGPRWLGYDLGHSAKWQAVFRRGFVEELCLEAPWANAFESICQKHPVRHLTLFGNGTALQLSEYAREFADCKGLSSILTLRDFTEVETAADSPTEESRGTLYWNHEGAVLSRLLSSEYLADRLCIHTNHAWQVNQQVELLRHPRLATASGLILRTKCRDGVILKWLQGCKNLRDLRVFVGLNEWGHACAHDFVESSVWANLRRFEYTASCTLYCEDETYEFPWYEALSQSNLHELVVSNGNLMETADHVSSVWTAFEKMSPLQSLIHLGLYHMPFNESALRALFERGHASNLEELRIQFAGFGGGLIPPEVLLSAPLAPKLETLGLSLNLRWESGNSKIANRIADCKLFNSVRHLDLSGGLASLENMRSLVSLGFFANLSTLVLPSRWFGSQGRESIADFVCFIASCDGLPKLHSLLLPDDFILDDNNFDCLIRLLENSNLPLLTAIGLNIGSLRAASRERLIETVENYDRPIWLCGLSQHPLERQNMRMGMEYAKKIASQAALALDNGSGELDQFLHLWQTGYILE
jgi:uncharacterized protein (TIGR02996 family)